MSRERLIYVQRPGGEPLWLPELMAEGQGIAERTRLTPAQYEGQEIQELLGRRLAAERGRKER